MNKMKALMLAGGLGVTMLASSISYGEPVDNTAKSVTVVENHVDTFKCSCCCQESSKQSSDKYLIQKVWEHGATGKAAVIASGGIASYIGIIGCVICKKINELL